MEKRGTIGIDIGGSKTMCALFDHRFAIVHEIKFKTQAEESVRAFDEALSETVDDLVDKAKKGKIGLAAVGVGCAGTVDNEKGTMKECPNIRFLKNFPFRKRLLKITGANVFLANDCHAGLYGEHQLGAARGLRHVIGVFIGTGIGAALVVDGRLHLGSGGHAGNLGNYLMHPVGTNSDREGILDNIGSRVAIASEAAVMAAKQWAPNLLKDAGTDVTKIKSANLARSIRRGDKPVEDLVRSRARIVGIALSNMVDFLNPEMIVLGGGLVEAMPVLLRNEIEAGIDKNASVEATSGLQVVVAKLKGHAVTAGAAKMALDTLTPVNRVH